MNLKNLHSLSLRLVVSLALAVLIFSDIAGAEDFLNDESYEDKAAAAKVADPIEPFNRVIYTFNDKLFLWVLNPVATGYSKVLPVDIRRCVSNFFYNLGEPVRSINCLLQGRFRDSGLTLSRFVINSTCGILGLADPATNNFKIAPINTSLGETFSVWGIGDGFYLVVPVLGPSTLRDFSGDAVETLAMTSYYPWNDDIVTSASVFSIQEINFISLHLGVYEDVKSLSFDPYVAFRNAYFQSRYKKNGHVIIPNPSSININR